MTLKACNCCRSVRQLGNGINIAWCRSCRSKAHFAALGTGELAAIHQANSDREALIVHLVSE